MDPEQFKAQINRLAAAYRIEVPPATRAAYLLAFQKTPGTRFAAVCEKAIEHEKAFPSIATLKEMLRHRHEIERTPTATLGTGTVGCLTCLDGGFVRRDDLAVSHPDFGKRLPCPACDGATKARDPAAEYRAFLARDHATMPPRAQDAPSRSITPPPDGFAKAGVPVPTTVTEAQRERARAYRERTLADIALRAERTVER